MTQTMNGKNNKQTYNSNIYKKRENVKITTIENNIIPQIYIVNDTYRLMKQLVNNCSEEIGWLALCKKEENNSYIIYDIEICEQECGATHTDLMESGLQEIASKFIKEGREDEMNNVRVWCHSHVNMECCPSAQDDKTLKEYYKNCDDYFIRIIMNKRNEINVTFVDKPTGLQFDNLKPETLYSKEEYDIIRKIKEHEDSINSLENLLKQKDDKGAETAKITAKELIKSNVKYRYNNYRYNDFVYGNNYAYNWGVNNKKDEKHKPKNNSSYLDNNEEFIYLDVIDIEDFYIIPFYDLGIKKEVKISELMNYNDVYYIASFSTEMAKEAAKEFSFTAEYTEKEILDLIDICREIVEKVEEEIEYEEYENLYGGYIA